MEGLDNDVHAHSDSQANGSLDGKNSCAKVNHPRLPILQGTMLFTRDSATLSFEHRNSTPASWLDAEIVRGGAPRDDRRHGMHYANLKIEDRVV